jgi:hypothetical protein
MMDIELEHMASHLAENELHILIAGGMKFYIDSATRESLNAFLLGAGSVSGRAQMVISSVAGENITVVAGAIDVMYSISPRTRALEKLIIECMQADEEDEPWKHRGI